MRPTTLALAVTLGTLSACGSAPPGGSGSTGAADAGSSTNAGAATGTEGGSSSGGGTTTGSGGGSFTSTGATTGSASGSSSGDSGSTAKSNSGGSGSTTKASSSGSGSSTKASSGGSGTSSGGSSTGGIGDAGLRAERGVYVPTFGQTPPATVLNNPDVDGVYVQVKWSDLQPDGGYLWTALDNKINAVIAVTPIKGMSLSIQAGDGTPAWVFASGVPSVHACSTSVATGTAIDETVPVPWSATYQSEWQAMVQATAQHLHDAGTYGYLGTVKLEGINGHTDETSMPNTTGTCANGEMPDPDAEWMDAGFTPTVLADASWTLVSAQASAFPDKALDLQVIEGAGAWPNGNQNAGLNQVLIDLAFDGGLGGRFETQSNGLNAVGGRSQDVTYALGLGAIGGYQMYNDVSNDPTCGMNKGNLPCDSTVLLDAINNGLDAGAEFLEIYQEDVDNPDAGFVAAVHWAHQALCGGGACP
jgi:hypothetical protein